MNTPVTIKLLKLYPYVQTPAYATPGSMCFDLRLYAPVQGVVCIRPGQRERLNTGLAVGLPDGWGINLYGRSGYGAKGLTLANGVGKIDTDYTGEIVVCMANHSTTVHILHHGDRIAQAEIVPVWQALFDEVRTLEPTMRGAGGFGSTGT